MITIANAVQRISAAFPHLAIENAELLAGGQYNAVVRVNDDLIFRFPRFAAGTEKLAREAEILDRIRPYVNTPIPRALCRHFEATDDGGAFAGYQVIQGEVFSRQAVAKLDTTAKVSIAEQLAAFLRELHAIPCEALGEKIASTGDDPLVNWRANWSEMATRLRVAVFPLVPYAVQAHLDTLFSGFLGQDVNFSFAPRVIRGDFGTGNILFQPATGTITGIIDFDSARLGDPACDLAALHTDDEQFARYVRQAYAPTAGEQARASFYRATFAAQEALYGVEHNDPDAFARGIAPYLSAQDANHHA